MFTNVLGIRLMVLIGETVPLPAPYEVTSALQQVEVTNDSGQGDGFQMTFSLGRNGLLDYGLLQNGTVDPMKRIIIAVTPSLGGIHFVDHLLFACRKHTVG